MEAHAGAEEPTGQAPGSRTVVWLTGIPGAGKTTVAGALAQELQRRGKLTVNLDGDVARRGLSADLGFSAEDRAENVRRVAEVAKLVADFDLIVIVSMISPFREGRQRARALFEPKEFIEVHVDAPVEVAERRDRRGLYRKARSGELRDFTGVDSPYEPPDRPELRLDTTKLTPEASALAVVQALQWMGKLGSS